MLSLPKNALLALLLALASAAGFAASAQKPEVKIAPFKFNGVEYIHRSSQDDKHDFTPRGHEDLQKQTDAIILLRYAEVVDGEGLAAAAKDMLEYYKKHEAIVVTNTSVPGTAEKPAEHLITVILGAREGLDAIFFRLTIADGAGIGALYSHRIYGYPAGKPMSAWMEKNGAAMEKALLSWENIPVPPAAKNSAQKPEAKIAPFKFNGVEYVHRWSEDRQHDFTPRDQEDLQNWTDMVTLLRYTEAANGEGMAATANDVLEYYKKLGAKVVTNTAVPRTAEKPPEHLITVIAGSREELEAVFIRLKIADGVGTGAFYHHRIAGDPADKPMSAWMEKNGAAMEKALMSWENIPIPAEAKEPSTAGSAAAADKTPKKLAPFKFNGAEYFHRWSQDDQHEFTPRGQEDLQKWTDMMTLHRYPKVVDRQSQDAAVGAIIENYKRHQGMIHTFQPVPATETNPAEYILIAILRGPGFMEAAFARFKLVDGIGASAVYSHRIHGESLIDRMEAWMEKNSGAMEKTLLSWEIPAPAVAKK